eukprot:CAMPEP_0171446840 /NCGR_PEP_ID=MMETSP0881-20121228/38801_1 /TAXON_ID=67004 /ORGANISM="Thalassiosira weissflogii, Strain CCMP1336" /LENGTH=102 /DNA_ID=CAMNT_0011971239 /DNA_START=8 /DNA_END=316 /DNA_ORIENTATION=+
MTMATSTITTTTTTTTMTNLLNAAKSSGRCPPSLIGEDRGPNNGEFETRMMGALEQGLNLGSEPIATDNFNAAIKVRFFMSDKGGGFSFFFILRKHFPVSFV